MTIDEQLIPFRGRCGFRQSIPKKPDKYGMKLFFICDCTSGYSYNGLPYTGREGDTRRVGLAEHVVKTLCNPVHNSGINVTTDNWFTSTKLAEDLLLKQITLLGMLRKTNQIFPNNLLQEKIERWCQVCLGLGTDRLLYPTSLRKTKPWSCFQQFIVTRK